MEIANHTLWSLLAILVLGLVLPEMLRKFRLPFITLIILAGAIFGPSGLNYVSSSESLSFIGFFGMAFLMLLTGIETDLRELKKNNKKIAVMALINGFIPFLVGVTIIGLFGYPWLTRILVGIVFISSSAAIIMPSLKEHKRINNKVAQLILSSVVATDIISLVALGFIFQSIAKTSSLPLPLHFTIIFMAIFALFYFIPKVSGYAIFRKFFKDEGHERQLRFVVIVLIGVLAFFSLLGVHPILASFLCGLALSSIIKKDHENILYSKLHTLGYGFFVPVFFFIVGMEMDLSQLKNLDINNILMMSLIFGLIVSKTFSGYWSGRLVKLSKTDSLIFGSVSIIKLTTTLAVTFVAATLGIFDSVIVTSVILLSVITTILGPLLTSYFARKL